MAGARLRARRVGRDQAPTGTGTAWRVVRRAHGLPGASAFRIGPLCRPTPSHLRVVVRRGHLRAPPATALIELGALHIAAAGDVACGSARAARACQQAATAHLIEPATTRRPGARRPPVRARRAGRVPNFYDASWGAFIDHRTPGRRQPRVPDTDGAAGYFGYFGARAGDPTQRLLLVRRRLAGISISLNSNCARGRRLRRRLAAGALAPRRSRRAPARVRDRLLAPPALLQRRPRRQRLIAAAVAGAGGCARRHRAGRARPRLRAVRAGRRHPPVRGRHRRPQPDRLPEEGRRRARSCA